MFGNKPVTTQCTSIYLKWKSECYIAVFNIIAGFIVSQDQS